MCDYDSGECSLLSRIFLLTHTLTLAGYAGYCTACSCVPPCKAECELSVSYSDGQMTLEPASPCYATEAWCLANPQTEEFGYTVNSTDLVLTYQGSSLVLAAVTPPGPSPGSSSTGFPVMWVTVGAGVLVVAVLAAVGFAFWRQSVAGSDYSCRITHLIPPGTWGVRGRGGHQPRSAAS